MRFSLCAKRSGTTAVVINGGTGIWNRWAEKLWWCYLSLSSAVYGDVTSFSPATVKKVSKHETCTEIRFFSELVPYTKLPTKLFELLLLLMECFSSWPSTACCQRMHCSIFNGSPLGTEPNLIRHNVPYKVCLGQVSPNYGPKAACGSRDRVMWPVMTL